MLFSVEQAFVGREEIRAPLKTPAWEASDAVNNKEITPGSVMILVSLPPLGFRPEGKIMRRHSFS